MRPSLFGEFSPWEGGTIDSRNLEIRNSGHAQNFGSTLREYNGKFQSRDVAKVPDMAPLLGMDFQNSKGILSRGP